MRRWLKRILIPLAILIALPVGFYFYAQWRGERELQAAIAELDATGEPWRWEDIEAARPKLDPKNDIRQLVLDVHRGVSNGFYMKKAVERALDLAPNRLIVEDDIDAFSDAMKSVEQALLLGRKLAAMPEARVHLDWPPGLAWPDVDIAQKARSTAYVLNCGAVWYAQQGDLDAAMECCLAMERLSESLQDEPTLIAHLIRVALQAIALGATERVLAQGQPSPQRLAELQSVWEKFDRERGLVNAFRGERAGSNRLFEQLASGKTSALDFTRGALGGRPSAWEAVDQLYLMASVKESHAWTLRHMTDVLKSFELPPAERIAQNKGFDQRVWKEAPPMARLLTPALQKVIEAHHRTEARTRCAIAALAVERFRCDQSPPPGRWPKTLEELCPKYLAKVPDDPFTGQALGYRPTANGVVLYSVGPLHKYDGSYRDDPTGDVMASSYEFRLWNVPQRRSQR